MININSFLLVPFFLLGFQDGRIIDKDLTNTDQPAGESFLLAVEEVFTIAGRGLLVTGVIERGTIRTGDSIDIVGSAGALLKTTVKSIEVFRQSVAEAKKGESVGLLLSGIESNQVQRGMVVCQPGSVRAYTEFRCKVHLNSKEEGGMAIPDKYRLLFLLRTAWVSGEIKLTAGKEKLLPGENEEATVTLVSSAALEKNMEFVLREGTRTVGKGKITATIQ